MRCEPDGKGAATVPEPGVLQARLLADFRRSVHRVRVGKGSGDVSETCGAGESSSREQPPSALARRSASAEASKFLAASEDASAAHRQEVGQFPSREGGSKARRR